jgi:hypothetical protein
VWKEVQGKGHIDVYFVIRDSRIKGFRSAQPINFAVITLDEDQKWSKLWSDLFLKGRKVPKGGD